MKRPSLAALAAAAAAAIWAPAPATSQPRPFELQGLVVTASPTPRAVGEVARSVTVLDGDDLRARGVARLADALRSVPGVAVVQAGSFGAVTSVFLRGGESDYVQVLVDGVPVNQPGGSFDFAGLSLDNVERIEVVRGPASSLYGSDAVSGVIHVITRTGRGAPSGEVVVRGGSYARREASARAEGGGGTASWSVGMHRVRSDGVYPVNSGFENSAATAHLRLAPDSATRAGVALRLADRSYRFPTDGAGGVVDTNAFTFGDEASASLFVSRAVSPRVELRATMTLARTDGGTDDQPDSPADTLGSFGFTSLDHVRRTGVDVRAHARLGVAVATLGVEVEEQKLRSFSEFLSQWGATTGRNENQRGNRAAYAHVTGSAGTVAFAAGSRLEDNDRFGRFATWNGEAAWHPAPDTRLRAAAGRALKEPSFFENFAEGWVRGNPDLVPERSSSVEAGVEQTVAQGALVLSATWFSQHFRDLIQYVSSPAAPGSPNYVNVAAAEASGLEVTVEGAAGPLRWGGEWTWLRSRVVDAGFEDGPGADFVRGARLLRRPSHMAGAHASFSIAAGTLRVDLLRVGARDDRDFASWPAERVELPAYTVVNAAAEAPLGRIRITVRGENLTGARYEEVARFPAPGRGLYLGVRVPFGGG